MKIVLEWCNFYYYCHIWLPEGIRNKASGRVYPKPSAGHHSDPNSISFLFCSAEDDKETLTIPCLRSNWPWTELWTIPHGNPQKWRITHLFESWRTKNVLTLLSQHCKGSAFCQLCYPEQSMGQAGAISNHLRLRSENNTKNTRFRMCFARRFETSCLLPGYFT